MKSYTFSVKNLIMAGGLAILLFTPSNKLSAQNNSKQIVLKNNSDKIIKDYTLEIPVDKLNLSFGSYIAEIGNQIVPVEIIVDMQKRQKAIVPVGFIEAGKDQKITIRQGASETYPKRTYAELSHKIGGQFIGKEYIGGYSWVKTNYMSLPGTFTDHSYYIKYEGPGWESDKVAFRFYLDNRNAIDVFGKTTSDLVLPAVGVDGFDNYHKLTAWGMDNLRVGTALGIGTIATWNGKKAIRVEKKDSTVCFVQVDGKIRSQIKTIYYGWNANGVKCDLTSLISIDAGSRASHMELSVNKEIDNIATGIIKDKNAELIVFNDKNSEWSYIASFGKQSMNKDIQGLAVFVRTKQLKEITSDEQNHVVILSPEKGYVEYYFMPTWELDKEPVKTKAQFMQCIDEVMNRLNANVSISIK